MLKNRKKHKTNATSGQKIVLDTVLEHQNGDEVASIVPNWIIENTIAIGRELSFHPVKSLAYSYNIDILDSICHNHDLNQQEFDTVIRLIQLNSGYLNPEILEKHLKKPLSLCTSLLKDLIYDNQAAKAPPNRELYSLPEKV